MSPLICLNPLLFKSYKASAACVFNFYVLEKSIDEYTRKLFFLNHCLTSKIIVEHTWCSYKYFQTSLEDFLITKEAKYLEPVTALLEFKTQAVIFIELYDKIRHEQLDQSGHNARVLHSYETHILELSSKLMEFSHQT